MELIRELWSVEKREPVRLSGTFYNVAGATRGPSPAHRIPIWLGGHKTRTLDLIGRTGDGWISSLGPLQTLEQQAAGNATIDRIAVAARRDPHSIRRAINIPAASATEGVMTQLVQDTGFDTFILISDDRQAIEAFGTRLAPNVRRLVAAS